MTCLLDRCKDVVFKGMVKNALNKEIFKKEMDQESIYNNHTADDISCVFMYASYRNASIINVISCDTHYRINTIFIDNL